MNISELEKLQFELDGTNDEKEQIARKLLMLKRKWIELEYKSCQIERKIIDIKTKKGAKNGTRHH